MIYLIGNSTRDKIITGDTEVETIGGTVWYAAQLMVRLMQPVAVVGFGDAQVKHRFEKQRVNVRHFSANGPVAHFENVYTSGQRQQHARIGTKLELSDIPSKAFEAPAMLVGPVLQDVDPAILSVRRKGLLLLDAQGFLRHLTPAHRVVEKMGPDAERAIRHCDILKIDAREARIITSTGHIDNALKRLHRMGPNVTIITQGPRSAHIYDGARFIQLSAPRMCVIDSTGAGDVFAAAFLTRYLDCSDAIIAGKFAIAAAGLSTRGFGTAAIPSQQEIEQLQKRHFHHPDTINVRNHHSPC